MRIVASSSPASNPTPQDSPQARCPGCGSMLSTREPGAIPTCSTCRRSHAEHEAWRLLGEVRDLAGGTGIYAELTAVERREQIQALVGLSHGAEISEPRKSALEALVNSLRDTAVDVLADLVSRRISDRKRQRPGGIPTLVRVAIADLSDAALIEFVGQTEDPVLLNAGSAELVRRLELRNEASDQPLYVREPRAEPDPATRYHLEGQIEVQGQRIEEVERPSVRAA